MADEGWGGWPPGEAGIRARVAATDKSAAQNRYPLDGTEWDLRDTLELLDKSRATNVERQQCLEVLGRAIAELMPDFRANGTPLEHSTAVAAELRRRFGGNR